MKYEHADYKDADDRGRVTLGKNHANSKVAIAWVEVNEPDPEDVREPTDDERNKLNELWEWASNNGYKALDFDVEQGRVYTDNAEWVNAEVAGLQE